MNNFPNRGFYRGNIEAALKDFGIAIVPTDDEASAITATVPPSTESAIGDEAVALASSPSLSPKLQGFTGNQCPKCFSMKMLATGHCETCQNCGETSSCG